MIRQKIIHSTGKDSRLAGIEPALELVFVTQES